VIARLGFWVLVVEVASLFAEPLNVGFSLLARGVNHPANPCEAHHDGVRFANGAEVALQKLGPGVKGYIYDALLSPLWKAESAEVM
jgi:hypothetical protein